MTSASIKEILVEFNLNGSATQWTPLNNGLINDTYLVKEVNGEQYILQKINTQVFKNVGILMANIQFTLPILNADDYEQITFLKTRSDKNYLVQNDEFWRMMTFIPNSTTYNTTTNPTTAFEAGRIIGRFHQLLQHIETTLIEDTLPNFHKLSHRKDEFKQALQNATKEKLNVADKAIKKAQHFITELAHLNTGSLPIRVCHNDTKLNNILFSKTSETALCLIDLDTIMQGFFFYDFGDAIRTIVNTAAEDEQDHSLITFNEALFTSFVNGLASNGPILSSAEKESLPLGTVFMPFLHGLRALTDYLNNNTYYKVSYENQNLDRCLSLFNFAEKALSKKHFMTQYIKKALH